MYRMRQQAASSASILLLSATTCCAGSLDAQAQDQASTTGQDRIFALKVYPLLKERCFACHGDDPEKIKGELNLTTREGMLKGGEYSNEVLVPGDANKSELYHSVTWKNPDLEMPPKENDRLTEDQISLLQSWIDSGAHWPSESIQKKSEKNNGLLQPTKMAF